MHDTVLAAKKVLLEGCAHSVPGRFEKIKDINFKCTAAQLQIDRCELSNQRLQFIKLTILEGWDTFAAVNRCVVEQVFIGSLQCIGIGMSWNDRTIYEAHIGTAYIAHEHG